MKIYSTTSDDVELKYGDTRIFIQPRQSVSVDVSQLPAELPSGLVLCNDDGTLYVPEKKATKQPKTETE